MSPTARTLAALRDSGWEAEVCEKWNHITKTRKDAFGCLDIQALRPGIILGVQATSASNMSARVRKIQAEPKAVRWLEAGGQIEVHGWAKSAKPVDRKWWRCRVVKLKLVDGEVVVDDVL